MRNDQIVLLLTTLMNGEKSYSSAECAELLKMSPGRFKKELRELRAVFEKNGFSIEGKTGRGNGYFLKIHEQKKFEQYLYGELPGEEKKDYNDQKNRIRRILLRLLSLGDQYIRMDDLAEEMMLSKSQLSKDINSARMYLKEYGIQMINRSHHGTTLEASEAAIRLCYANIIANDVYVDRNGCIHLNSESSGIRMKLEEIKEVIVEKAEEYQYQLSDITIQNLSTHLYIALIRIGSRNQIVLDLETMDGLRTEPEFLLAEAIVKEIEKRCDLSLPQEEVCYITMHLSTKKIVTNENMDEDVMALVHKMLERVYEKYGLDFRDNLDLEMMLGYHTLPLLKRIRYHTVFHNPLLKEIQMNYMKAYDIALCACEVIGEQYGCTLAADEVGYYTLHFKVAMDGLRTDVRKNILVVCSSGRGTAELLRVNFQRRFGEQIDRLDTCNVFELKTRDLSGYDCIFTTVPIYMQLPLPVFRINTFFDAGSERTIQHVFEKKQKETARDCIFSRELFFTEIEAETEKEVIHKMIQRISAIRQLPEQFEEQILAREALQSTRLGELALPHPNGVMDMDEMVSVAVLKKPVLWGKQPVQLVILMAFGKDFRKNNEKFFDFLLSLVNDRKRLKKCITEASFDAFLELYQEME